MSQKFDFSHKNVAIKATEGGTSAFRFFFAFVLSLFVACTEYTWMLSFC